MIVRRRRDVRFLKLLEREALARLAQRVEEGVRRQRWLDRSFEAAQGHGATVVLRTPSHLAPADQT